ncbi:MAG: DUF1015 domain-containing protein [Planctomycetota bacterium]
MPELRPFHGVRYAGPAGLDAGPTELSTKIAPPYDVLDAGPKAALLEQDPHNIVAIDLPVTPPKTVGPDAAYAEAGDLYRRWLSEGVLVRDDRPGVVIYEQAYGSTPAEDRLRRRGVLAVLGVEEFNRPNGGIFRHEMTIAGGVSDRTKLMEATRAQLSPIFGIYPDSQHETVALIDEACDSAEPDMVGTTADGVTHRCWVVRHKATIKALKKFFAATDVFIADGHHRYTTALQFAGDHPELPGADGCLFMLVAANAPGMMVLPTHRVICGLQAFSFEALIGAVEADGRFVVRPWPYVHEHDLNTPRFRLVDPAYPDDPYWVWLRGADCTHWEATELGLGQTDVELPPGPRAQLDVSVLHDLFIDQILRSRFGGEAVTFKYTADQDEMVRWAGEGTPGTDDRIGVLLESTDLRDVMAVSRANEVMPPKSTYFYPKLATGLVINPLD